VTSLYYVQWFTSWSRRSIVSFGLSPIPVGSIISSATLTLKETGTQGTTRTIAVHRVTQSWTEGGVTWNSRDGTNSWTTAGGDFVSSPTATASVIWTGVLDTDTWDVTSDVQAFVPGAVTNYGWLVKDQTEYATYRFSVCLRRFPFTGRRLHQPKQEIGTSERGLATVCRRPAFPKKDFGTNRRDWAVRTAQ